MFRKISINHSQIYKQNISRSFSAIYDCHHIVSHYKIWLQPNRIQMSAIE